MLTLAFDSSAKPASCAVFDGKLIGQSFQNNGNTHSTTLMPMAESLLKNLGLDLRQIELFAVSHGPGSFTGVRIGVSLVKGLAWGLDKPVCGVSTLEAMAYQTPCGGGFITCAVMDARRGQVYNALFENDNGIPRRLCPDRAVSLAELYSELERSELPWVFTGDGAELACDFFKTKNADSRVSLAPELLRFQTAYGVALASWKAQHITSAELEPFYLRPSQAERERTDTNQPSESSAHSSY